MGGKHCPVCGAPHYNDHCFNCGYYIPDEEELIDEGDGSSEGG